MSSQEPAKLSDLQPDQHNANKGTERGRALLEKSLRQYGAGRSILLDKHGRIIAGNKTAQVAGEIGLEDVVIVRTNGDKIVAVLREDLDIDSEAGRMLAHADNRINQVDYDLDIDVMQLDIDNGLPLEDFWFDFELQGMGLDVSFDLTFPDGDGLDFLDDIPLPGGVPDTIWPSDNEWGVPLLDINRQADAFDLPIEIWGAKGRGTKAGTYLFYTEDYRFSALWHKPQDVPLSGCINAAEPNFSVYKDFPPAVALYRTYQKRWLARYWQSQGVRVFVDLNVNPEYYEVNLLGVPVGWKAYATRGYSDRLEYTLKELEMAEEHAGGSVLFLVYGGGKAVKEFCREYAGRGVVWSDEIMDRGVAFKGR